MRKRFWGLFLSLCLASSSFLVPHTTTTAFLHAANGEIDRPMGSWAQREPLSQVSEPASITHSPSAQPLAEKTQVKPSAPSNTVARGIDLSYHNGTVDFSKVKKEVDFVIIRCGYGSDDTDQDDTKFETYVKGCRDNDIPYGIYLYSYADTEAKSKSEAKHTLRQLNKLKDWNTAPSLPIFYDLEDSKQETLSNSILAAYAKNWCTALENEGYTTGIYANSYWWTEKLTNSYFDKKIKWIAEWPTSDAGASSTKSFYEKNADGYSMWQYTSQDSISGINSNVDSNYMLKDIFLKKTTEPDNPPVVDPEQPSVYEDVIANGYKGVYDGASHTVTIQNTRTILYSTDQTTWQKKSPARKKVGTTTVYYKGTDLGGKSVSGSVTITITPLSISKVTFAAVKNKTYTGKAIKPKPVITFHDTTLKEGTDYSLSYGTNKSTGKATIKVSGKGNFKSSKTLTFYIVPQKVTGITCSKGSASKSTIVKWKKVTGASGYQLAYSPKGKNTWTYVNVTSLTKTFRNLRSRKYDIKIRAYKTVNGIKKYGAYSTAK